MAQKTESRSPMSRVLAIACVAFAGLTFGVFGRDVGAIGGAGWIILGALIHRHPMLLDKPQQIGFAKHAGVLGLFLLSLALVAGSVVMWSGRS